MEQGTSRLRLLPRFLHPSRPVRSSPPPGARGLTWRGVSASHPRPGTCERRTNSNLPRLTHPRLGAGGGSGVSGDSHKVSPPGDAQALGRARCAGPGPGLSQVLPATHSPRERSCPLFRRPHLPGTAPVAEVSAAAGPGKPRVSRCASGRLQPAEPPLCHPPVAAAPPHLLSASRTSSVPTTAFVSPSSKFLTSGRSAPGRRTAGGTFFPSWGRAGKGLATRLPPLELRRGRSVPAGVGWTTSDHQQTNNGELSRPRRGRLSPALRSRLPLCSVRPALNPSPQYITTPPRVKPRLLRTWPRPQKLIQPAETERLLSNIPKPRLLDSWSRPL